MAGLLDGMGGAGLLGWLFNSPEAKAQQPPGPDMSMFPRWMHDMTPEEATRAMEMLEEARRRDPMPASPSTNRHSAFRVDVRGGLR